MSSTPVKVCVISDKAIQTCGAIQRRTDFAGTRWTLHQRHLSRQAVEHCIRLTVGQLHSHHVWLKCCTYLGSSFPST